MQVFLLLFGKILPLYALILLGFVAGRALSVSRESVASLLIYVIAPIVVFNAVWSSPWDPSFALLPILFYGLSCSISLLAYWLSQRVWRSPLRNILAFLAGSGNTGYFGLPVAMYLFGEDSISRAVLAGFGMILFENTLGFFLTARGHHTAQESFRKVLRLPVLYAFSSAIALNALGVAPPKAWDDFAIHFRGAYSVLGMMLLGIGVAGMKRFEIDWRLVGMSFFAKFLLWPATVLSVIAIDATCLGFWDSRTHEVLLLMGLVPLPANAVAIATELKTEPEAVAMTVLGSTVFGLFYIPAMIAMAQWLGLLGM
jgi:predicted permease